MSETRCTCGNGCETFGQCMRRKRIRIGQVDASEQRRWDNRLNKFHAAVAQGIEPRSTSTADIDRAVEWSNRTGKAFGS